MKHPKQTDLRQDHLNGILENFPKELIRRDQWVLWRFVEREGRMTKVPFQPNGAPADSANPATWSTCQDVMSKFQAEARFDGIGYVFSAADPYVGIDLDKCRDPQTGKVEQWAEDILAQMPTYSELSPSGKGYHLIGKAKLPSRGRRKGQIEMYESGRYFTVTGHRCSPEGVGAEDIQAPLMTVHAATFGAAPAKASKAGAKAANDAVMTPSAPTLEDQVIIDAILASSDAESFKRFQAGEWQALQYPSQSEGDLALAGILARHGANTAEQLDRLFRTTGMLRDKWDENRGAETYGAITVAKALEGVKQLSAVTLVVQEMNRRLLGG